MKIINCTPHDINAKVGDEIVTYKASGILPRVENCEKEVTVINGVPCVVSELGSVAGLPEPKTGTMYIVSRMVLDASERHDLLAPDSGKTAVRNEKGHILYVIRWIVQNPG